ncbi:hypothetical protein Xind_01209 [Xenorhabdus indica]|nr:hypothetical protein [Xenorhabdus indica]
MLNYDVISYSYIRQEQFLSTKLRYEPKADTFDILPHPKAA